jgi:cation-transporting ATPase E
MQGIEHRVQGLTNAEVLARREQGQGNDVEFRASRTYLQILRKNAFTLINTVLFGISLVLVAMAKYGDALVTAGLVLLNVIVGVFQEGRAKRKLEQIALLARPKAVVIRDGQEQSVDPGDVVLDDVLVVGAGDQIVVDGAVIGEGRIEVDESLLTGESEHVVKQAGDPVFSGSFCVTGSACYRAQKVGGDSLVNRMTAGARAYRQVKTPLQRDINYVVRILVLLTAQLGLLIGLSLAVERTPLVEGMRVAAVIVALVPQGLFFMSTVAYAMGAVRVARQGALIEELNAVESMSNVDLLCLDKTGTLTTNRIRFYAMCLVGSSFDGDEQAVKQILGAYAASLQGGTRTTAALLEAFGGEVRVVVQEVPFSSERKWSALSFDDPDLHGAFVLGAPEVLDPYLSSDARLDPSLGTQLEKWTRAGLRVLLLAHCPDGVFLDAEAEPQLPHDLIPVCLLSLSDELRPEAQETLRHFADLGIRLKIISGDNPDTVAALARQAGFSQDIGVLSGLELEGLDDAQLAERIAGVTVLGRVTPQQKEKLVRLFRERGFYVAMIGDGVNDVLSLKQADVGIAMQSGSQATRSVADIVLLDDSFASLPVAFREGQRIVRGVGDVMRLLLTRTFYVLLLVVATQIVGVPFPVTPKHNSVLALLTVGIPILAIAAWARPGAMPKSMIRSVSQFVFPAAFTVSVLSLVVYLSYLGMTGGVASAQSALTTITVFCGLLLVPFVEPPTSAWVGGDELSGDRRPALMTVGLLVFYVAILAMPPLRDFFELTPLRLWDYLLLGVAALIWALLVRLIWRTRVLERLLPG